MSQSFIFFNQSSSRSRPNSGIHLIFLATAVILSLKVFPSCCLSIAMYHSLVTFKTELVWKVTNEWYIAMDKQHEGKTLRERMTAVAKKIKWMPEFGLERELDWLKNMNDWLISKKNRYWGLALPIYECKKCGHFEVLGSKEELKKRSISGWDKFDGKTPHKPYIDEIKIKCSKFNDAVSRTLDVGNPWLDAGIVPYSTITESNQGEPLYLKDKKEWKKWFPADFITESCPGQFKNWFYDMVDESTVLEK